MTTHPGARLRSLMDASVVAAPGAFNALVGMAVARAGFDAAYVSGGATSVAAGVPDVGLLTLEHFCRVIREVADGSGLPVLADADTGFGEAEMVRRTVIEYHRAGAAGLHLEDQVFPKRCGHLDGKALVPTDHMCEKVAWAAKASRDCSDGAFVVCARTDARGVDGMDAAVERAQAYVEAGADMIFPEGLKSEAEFGEFARAMKGDAKKGSQAPRHQGTEGGPYLLANMTEFGKTPLIPLARFGEMGYDLVIYPVSMLRVAMGAVTRALATLKAEGTVGPFLGEMQTREELYGLVGYTPGEAWEFPV
ncbi:MAG: isocitrate lyase/phosphoenolpyruvate mutase family protein [Phycisphaerales bacterium]|nr:isocitrate lyase/phosphoenolpyruvate mutase family protein [Phycisphaerales bacterium]